MAHLLLEDLLLMLGEIQMQITSLLGAETTGVHYQLVELMIQFGILIAPIIILFIFAVYFLKRET